MAKRKKNGFCRNALMVFVLFIVFGGSAVLLPDSWTQLKRFTTEAGTTWFLGIMVFMFLAVIERLSPNQRRTISVRA